MVQARSLILVILVSTGLAWTARAGGVSSPSGYDALINLGTGPFADQSQITNGNAQPWYDSMEVAKLFGGAPTLQQQQSFDATILERVQQTFQLSGIPITLTDNSKDIAAHTLSLVSGATSQPFPGAIGTTVLGSSGLSFVDLEAKSAQSIDQLEWIVAHNISHELMLAFGVGENYDKTGNFIDAASIKWATITSSDATFSSSAAQAILASLASVNSSQSYLLRPQSLEAAAVPEPTTLCIWGLSGAVVLLRRARLAKGSCRFNI